MASNDSKRLFFAFDIVAPWPQNLPQVRLLAEKDRHLTVAFLGQCNFEKLKSVLNEIPLPDFKVGIVGQFDQLLFLPPRHPHVAAWRIKWLEEEAPLNTFNQLLQLHLEKIGFAPNQRHRFLPHVTLSRSPFPIQEWKKCFVPLPLMTGSFHLYESLGHSQYQSIWEHKIPLPFVEIEHTADIGYTVLGKNFQALYDHAKVALCFSFPPLLNYLKPTVALGSIEEVVMALNEIVAKADGEIGCPFKAVSFHGGLQKEELYRWEMIIDV